MTAFTFAMSGGPPAFTTAAISSKYRFPAIAGVRVTRVRGLAGIKVVEAVHDAARHEQGIARSQSMCHAVEGDGRSAAEAVPYLLEVAMIMRRRDLGLLRHGHVKHRQLATIVGIVDQEPQPQRTYSHLVRHERYKTAIQAIAIQIVPSSLAPAAGSEHWLGSLTWRPQPAVDGCGDYNQCFIAACHSRAVCSPFGSFMM
jgi:hypothetical protein